MTMNHGFLPPKTESHKWRFVRIGGFDHVLIDSPEDVRALPNLDQKLWAALSCPTQGLEFDTATLTHMDKEKDGRIRAVEMIEALNWTLSLIQKPEALFQHHDSLHLADINENCPEGRDILTCAREILKNNGKTGHDRIGVADLADKAKAFSNTLFNGDGVIPAESAEDPAVRCVIEEIITCLGPETDRSGLPGINREKADLFFKEARDYSQWWQRAESADSGILPLGKDTPAAAEAFGLVREKIDDYFTRCRLAAMDDNAAQALNPGPDAYLDIAKAPLSSDAKALCDLPLTRIRPNAPLDFQGPINPAWEKPLADFLKKGVRPLLREEKTVLDPEEWLLIKDRLSGYGAWKDEKKDSPAEKLGIERIREILESPAEKAVSTLLEQDLALEAAASSFDALDKLIRYYCNLYTLLNNFVSFRDFYTPGKKAVFQAGTLYIDQRSCELCIRVKDAAAHSALAQMGGVYLAYCECTRKDSPEKIIIAAAFTQGDSDNLMVGRNGVFYDRKNQDWDATIIKIVDHPISVRQAFWSPYKRLARMVRAQIQKFASEKDKAVDKKAITLALEAGKKAEEKPVAPPPFDVGKFAGIFAAIGLAVGALGTAAASVVTGFMGLSWWQIPIAILGIMLLVSGPSIIMAALKLRRRNLSPILDACGWAVNSKARINISFGSSLTRIAELPAGSSRLMQDPYAPKKSNLRIYLFLLVLLILAGLLGLGIYTGKLF